MYFDAPVDEMGSVAGVGLMDELVAAGLDDATFAQSAGRWFALVDRDGGSFVDAVMSAFAQVEHVEGCVVRSVLPEDLVSARDIADRFGKTRQWANQHANGTRGPGSFPIPFSGAGSVARWRWVDIERYFTEGAASDQADVTAESAFLETLNAALEFRNRSRDLAAMSRSSDTRKVVNAVLRDTLNSAA
jgi:hypothetical protein